MNAMVQHPGSQESKNGAMKDPSTKNFPDKETEEQSLNIHTSIITTNQNNHPLSQYNPFYLPSKTASPSPKFSPKTTYHEIPTSGPGTSSPARLLEYQTELSLLHPNGGMKSPNTFLLHPRNVLEADKRDREKGCSREIAARLLGN
ncbi:hypothetical protein BELL_0504g00020 [Botrytis elliptica]|uniref:Uncharacterized protein n=1 Tax=Botrytis elliptica TaxID=278938 RepID=A0A4Z1JKI0_9HELO|nr:hypothetical protein BELL_0504g00020 [Botrytis elliptica]